MSCRSNPGNSAVTSFARATSGLSDVQTLHLFHRLIREGQQAQAVAPTSAQIEAWRQNFHQELAQQTQPARVGGGTPPAEDAMSERRLSPNQSQRIQERLNHLPTSIDGPTFYAWQNLAGRASRSAGTLNLLYMQLGVRLGQAQGQPPLGLHAMLRREQELLREFEQGGVGANWQPPADLLERLVNDFPNMEQRLRAALPQDRRTLYVLSRLTQELPAGLPQSQSPSTSHEPIPPPPLSVPRPASAPRWVQQARAARGTLDEQRRARQQQAEQARQVALRQVQEAALRQAQAFQPAPRLSGSESQALYDQWVAEVQTARRRNRSQDQPLPPQSTGTNTAESGGENTGVGTGAGGGPPYETEYVLGAAATQFGVEMEFKEADADRVARRLYDLGLAGHPQMMPYHHSCSQCQGKWKVERDGSVTQQVGRRNLGGEVVAPVLEDKPEHWQQLQQVTGIIRELGGRCDQDTGQHVHVSTASYGLEVRPYRELAQLVAQHEDLLFRLSAPDVSQHRGLLRDDHPDPYHYTQPIAGRVQRLMNDARARGRAEPTLREVLTGLGAFAASGHYGSSSVPQAHYLSLNVQHVHEDRSRVASNRVEFRTFNGTIDPVQIQTNVRLAAGLVHAASVSASTSASAATGRAVPSSASEAQEDNSRPVGWHQTHSTSNEDSYQLRAFLDRLGLPESGAKAVLDTFLRSQWQSSGNLVS